MDGLAVLDILIRGIVLPVTLVAGLAVLAGYVRAAHREGMARLAAYEARERARQELR